MAASKRPEWPRIPGLTADYLAAEDIDISVVLRKIALSKSRIETGIRALETVSAANVNDSPFMFRLQRVTEFARALKLREEGLGKLEAAAFVPLILALLGRGTGAGALSTFIHVDLTYEYDLAPVLLEGLEPFPLLDKDMTASLCANLGHQSSKVRDLCLEGQKVFGNEQCCEMLAAALRSNRCLKVLYLPDTGLGSEGVKLLVSGLKENQTLERLDIGFNPHIGDEGTGYVAELLKDNTCTSLNLLQMYCTGMEDGGADFLSTALARNTKLRTLDLGDNRIGKNGLTLLLELLTPASDAHGPDRPNNTTLTQVELGDLREFPVESMALMIERNTSLDRLNIAKAPLSSDEWVTHIIPALKKNSTLRVLYASGSEGVTATGVLEALVDLLKTSNTALELINVDDTPLSKAGMAGRLAEELLRNNNFKHALSLLPKAKAKSCRVVLCGREYAGKSTLCEALFKLVRQQRPATGDGPTTSVAQVREQASLRDKELDSEISINVLTDESGNRISVWDFAGHRGFHALHRFIFPSTSNTATQFVMAFSPIISPNERIPASGEVKTLVRFEEEVLYWLRFIASNTRPGSAAKPSVVVVITNRDRLAAYTTLKDEVSWLSGAEDVVSRLEAQFRDLITLQRYPCIVNARDVEDDGLNKWVHEIQESFKRKLAGLHDEPVICSQVVKQLDGLPTPIMSTAEFAGMCKSLSQAAGIPYEEGGWRPVAAYLQDVGEVIYHDTLDFIITNPRWFGHGVFGILVDPFSNSSQARHKPGTNHHPRNGFINKRHLSNLLEKALESVPGMDSKMGVQPDQLIQLLMLLDLCYEASPGDPKTGYFFPALFGDEDSKAANGTRPRTWYTGWEGDLRFIHLGRRLECADRNRTMLTDGFYPRLQVELRKHALEKWDVKETVSLEKNLFRIRVNSMEILVEYSGFSGYFVDILVMSSLPHSETVQFVHDNFVSTIRKSCASHEGCPGVTLSEAIIRPACFEAVNPVLCAYRKDQASEIDELTKCIISFPDYRHSWPEVRNEAGRLVLPAGSDSAISLLNGELASLDCYPCRIVTDGQKRGVAVIISMESMESWRPGGSRDRERLKHPGASRDRERLKDLADRLGLVAYVLVDYRAGDLREKLKHLADKIVPPDDECFVCFVNAHGGTNKSGEHYIEDEYRDKILLDVILAPFKTCEQLRGKPKVFFVNGCRGSKRLTSADNPRPSGVRWPPYMQPVECSERRYVEDFADALVAFSTSAGSVTWINPVEGTAFVTALVKAFDSKRHTTDVYNIIKNVNFDVFEKIYNLDGISVRQCPIMVDSLTKHFYLR